MGIIKVEHLQKDFKKIIKQGGLMGSFKSLIKPRTEIFTAVNDLEFEIPKGQIFGFIGPNGAGKSTTIKMLTGILSPTSGQCTIDGKNPQHNRKEYVKDIGVVFGQRTQLWWDLPLSETYSVLKEIYDVPSKKFDRKLEFLNDVLDLQDFISQPVRTLSLGQRMRADIAASLLHSPKVLFLDEPTIGLDVAVKDNIRKAILNINKEENTTIVLTTHDLSDIELLCNRIFLIDKGSEIFDGTVGKLKKKFGKIHELKLELAERYPLVFPNLSDFTCEQKGVNVSIKFDVTKISVSELVQKALEQTTIKDISVKEVDIEDIIRRIYRKETILSKSKEV